MIRPVFWFMVMYPKYFGGCADKGFALRYNRRQAVMVRHDVTETLADSDRRDTESNTLSVRMVGRNSVRDGVTISS